MCALISDLFQRFSRSDVQTTHFDHVGGNGPAAPDGVVRIDEQETGLERQLGERRRARKVLGGDLLRIPFRARAVMAEGRGPEQRVVRALRKVHARPVRRHEHRHVDGVRGRGHAVRGPHEHRRRGPGDERRAEPSHQGQVQVGVARLRDDQIVRVRRLLVQLAQRAPARVLLAVLPQNVEHVLIAVPDRRREHVVHCHVVRVHHRRGRRRREPFVDDLDMAVRLGADVRKVRVHGDVVP